jgi:hypothetical protein
LSSLTPALPPYNTRSYKSTKVGALQAPTRPNPNTTTGSTRLAHGYRLHAVCLDGMFNIGTQLAEAASCLPVSAIQHHNVAKYQHDT